MLLTVNKEYFLARQQSPSRVSRASSSCLIVKACTKIRVPRRSSRRATGQVEAHHSKGV